MSKITKSARGQACRFRLFDPYTNSSVCDIGPETVVFCHAPSATKGMGIKSESWWGSYGCASCHAVMDGRSVPGLNKQEVWLRAIHETHKILFELGLLTET